jgi:hypothetical protein
MSKYKNVELVKPSGLELKDRLVSVNRVTKATVELRFSAIVVVGDENGVVGHGLENLKMSSNKRKQKMLRKFSKKFFEWSTTRKKGNWCCVFFNSALMVQELLLVELFVQF